MAVASLSSRVGGSVKLMVKRFARPLYARVVRRLDLNLDPVRQELARISADVASLRGAVNELHAHMPAIANSIEAQSGFARRSVRLEERMQVLDQLSERLTRHDEMLSHLLTELEKSGKLAPGLAPYSEEGQSAW